MLSYLEYLMCLYYIVHMFAAPSGVIPCFDNSAVLFELQQLKASQQSVLQQLLAFSRELAQVRVCLSSQGGGVAAVGEAPNAQHLQPVLCMSWTCPVCGKNLSHKESFKGHIRKLVYPSKRPGCHLNPLVPQHQLFVHRFDGINFYEQSREFCKEFYYQTCISCTKRDLDDASLSHIWAWLDAARSDDLPFPEYDTRCQMVSSKRSCSAARGDSVLQDLSQSTAVSSSSGGSSSFRSSSSPNL
jgi:hypothetical protein